MARVYQKDGLLRAGMRRPPPAEFPSIRTHFLIHSWKLYTATSTTHFDRISLFAQFPIVLLLLPHNQLHHRNEITKTSHLLSASIATSGEGRERKEIVRRAHRRRGCLPPHHGHGASVRRAQHGSPGWHRHRGRRRGHRARDDCVCSPAEGEEQAEQHCRSEG